MEASVGETAEEIKKILDRAYKERVNDLDGSIKLAKQALELSNSINNKLCIANSLIALSLFFMIQGEFATCITMAEQAVEFFEELGNEKGIADAKYNIAGVYYRTDDYHLGLNLLVSCRTIYKKLKDYNSLSKVEKSFGTIYEYLGDQKNAIKSYNSAIAAAKSAGNLNFESNAYNPLSGIYLKQGKVKKAMEVIENSIAIKRKTGDERGFAFAIYGRGKVYAHKKQYKQAENDYTEALKIHKKVGDKLGIGMTYYKLGALYAQKGDKAKAKKVLKQGLQHSGKYNMAVILIKCNYLLYKILKEEKKHTESLKYLEQYVKEKESVLNTQTLKVIENYELITKVEALENEAKVQQEKAKIIEKKNRAEEEARVRQEFLSNMSHELRTPLNAVIMITNLLGEGKNEEERQLIESLRFASNNLLRIINDILDFTKLDIAKVKLEPNPVKLKTFVESIRLTYESLAREKGIYLKAEIDPQIAVGYEMDDTKISQILGNLISNAIKFTDKGGVKLKISKISGDKRKDKLRFEVIDTGVGIPKESQKEVFKSFSQPKQITTKKHGGSGLGLAIVKKLIELHKSKIHLESIEGKGSIFSFTLALTKADIVEEKQESLPMTLEGKTVLLVEDNKVNAMVATKLLGIWGMNIEHAVNGIEAVDKSGAKPFDYILMDIHMPEMNGFDATIKIRESKNPNMTTPIFALTADTTVSEQKKYTKYFDGVLRKPIEIEKLFASLSKASRQGSTI